MQIAHARRSRKDHQCPAAIDAVHDIAAGSTCHQSIVQQPPLSLARQRGNLCGRGGGATEGNFRAAMVDTDFGPLWWIWKTRQGRQIRIHHRKTSSVVPPPPHNAEGGGCHRSLGPGRPTWILTGQPHWPKAAVLGARGALTTRSLSITKRSAVNRVHALEHAVPMQGSALWADMLGGAA